MPPTHLSGLIASNPVAWVSSGRHIVIPFGRILRVFDVTTPTPQCIALLRGHSGPVVSVTPAGEMRVASASEDGTVRVWDVDDGSCLRTIDVGQKITHMCQTVDEKLLCFATKRVVLITLAKKEKSKFRRVFADCTFDSSNGRVASSQDGTVVAVIDKRLLELTSVAKGKNPVVVIKHYSWLTSVAVSRDGSMLAVGDEKGTIFVYPHPKSMFPNSNKTVRLDKSQVKCSPLHWHSAAVRGLAFSQDGRLLVSGGTEAALVTWKMTRGLFGDRAILPRLKSPILGISVSNDESTYALTHADNSIRLIDQVANTICATIRGISSTIMDFHPDDQNATLSSRTSSDSVKTIRMTRDTRERGRVLICGNGGEIQLFDVQGGVHRSAIPVITRNSIFEPRKAGTRGRCSAMACVTDVRMDPSGRRMISVESQRLFVDTSDGFGGDETVTTLRFWNVSHESDNFNLSAVFCKPHGVNAGISSISFHPQISVAATASPRGTFKLWRETKCLRSGREASWRSEAQFTYKGLPCNSVCFSNDGSLLAVACGSVLTLWHVEDNYNGAHDKNSGQQDAGPDLIAPSTLRVEFLHALVHPPAEETIQSVLFVHNRVPLFVTATDAGLYVWNALTQGIWWSSRIRTNPRSMAVDANGGLFAVAVQIPAASFGEDSHAEDEERDDERDICIKKLDVPQEDELVGKSQDTFESDFANSNGMAEANVKRAKHTLKRSRSEPNPEASRASISQNEQGNTYCPADSAIAIFDATSPVPVRISRLATGVSVTSLEFVPVPSSTDIQSALVCIDSNLELCFYDKLHESNAVSLVTDRASATEAEGCSTSASKLDQLLGPYRGIMDEGNILDDAKNTELHQTAEEWRLASRAPLVLDRDEPESQVAVAFRKYFDEPIHIQASVASKSVDFIHALLPKTKEATRVNDNIDDAGNSKATASVSPPIAVHSGNPQDTRKENQAPTTHQYEACRAFCAGLVKSHLRRLAKSSQT